MDEEFLFFFDDLEEDILFSEFLTKSERNKYLHSQEWCNNYIEDVLEIQFHNNFKIKRNTLRLIIKYIYEREQNIPICTFKEYLHIFLFYVTRSVTYRDLADKFGRSTDYCRESIKKAMEVIISFKSEIIRLPEIEEYIPISEEWATMSEIKGTLLSIDGTHISVTAPSVHPERYINRKSYHSVNYIMACDSFGYIRYVYGPGFGSSHDAFLYRLTTLKDWVDGLPEEFHVIGDSAFPASESFLTPLKAASNRQDIIFNNMISKQRIKIECVFGEFKKKFAKFGGCIVNGERKFYKDLLFSSVIMFNLIKKFK